MIFGRSGLFVHKDKLKQLGKHTQGIYLDAPLLNPTFLNSLCLYPVLYKKEKFFAIKALKFTDAMVPNSFQVYFTLILAIGIRKG